MKIAIVGGGIGGLTAALALSQNSHDITVFERSAGIRLNSTPLAHEDWHY